MSKGRPHSEPALEVVELVDQADSAPEKKKRGFLFPLVLLIFALIAFLVLKQLFAEDDEEA